MIKYTYSGEGVTADEETISSCGCTLSGEGVTADVVAIGSCRCTLSGGRLVADKMTMGSCAEGPTADVMTICSIRS
jgi:hypothetical protein